MLQRFIACLALAGFAAGLNAGPLTPASYTYGTGPSGSYPDDAPGGQLTDGLLNAVSPGASLGVPDATNWVGWDGYRNPSITFDFGQVVTISQLTIDTVRWEAAGVYLPTQVTINATPFSVPTGFTNLDKAVLTFSGSWTGSSLTVDMTSGGYWTFVDEISFDGQVGTSNQGGGGSNNVPDTGSTLLLTAFALSGMGMVAKRRKRS